MWFEFNTALNSVATVLESNFSYKKRIYIRETNECNPITGKVAVAMTECTIKLRVCHHLILQGGEADTAGS